MDSPHLKNGPFETQSSYCRTGWGRGWRMLGVLPAPAKTIKAKGGRQRQETMEPSAVRKCFPTLQLPALFVVLLMLDMHKHTGTSALPLLHPPPTSVQGWRPELM